MIKINNDYVVYLWHITVESALNRDFLPRNLSAVANQASARARQHAKQTLAKPLKPYTCYAFDRQTYFILIASLLYYYLLLYYKKVICSHLLSNNIHNSI